VAILNTSAGKAQKVVYVAGGDSVPALLMVAGDGGLDVYRVEGENLERFSFGRLAGGVLRTTTNLPAQPGDDSHVTMTFSHSSLQPLGGSVVIDLQWETGEEMDRIAQVLLQMTGAHDQV
jgi:hypothetical protein